MCILVYPLVILRSIPLCRVPSLICDPPRRLLVPWVISNLRRKEPFHGGGTTVRSQKDIHFTPQPSVTDVRHHWTVRLEVRTSSGRPNSTGHHIDSDEWRLRSCVTNDGGSPKSGTSVSPIRHFVVLSWVETPYRSPRKISLRDRRFRPDTWRNWLAVTIGVVETEVSRMNPLTR